MSAAVGHTLRSHLHHRFEGKDFLATHTSYVVDMLLYRCTSALSNQSFQLAMHESLHVVETKLDVVPAGV